MPCKKRSLTAASPSWALRKAEDYLTKRRVPEARANAEFLLAGILGVKRTELGFQDSLSPKNSRSYWRMLCKMSKERWPLAYLLGTQDFMGLTLEVKKGATLIPRPETEILVEQTIEEIRKRWPKGSALKICDVGTGSGCIALALNHFLGRDYDLTIWATDISGKALRVAKKNAAKLGAADIKWRQCSLFSGLPTPQKFNIIVSNPPYVSSSDYAHLDPHIKLHEPRQALLAGKDGLDTIRPFIAEASLRLTKGGWLGLEIDPAQSKSIAVILKKSGFNNIHIVNDFAGHQRVVTAELPLPMP